MAIRIKCDLEGYDKCWVDFRSHSWPFGDRRKMLEGATDIESLTIILGYIEVWNMLSVSEKKVPFDTESGIDNLDTLDEVLVNWVIQAWFEARAAREELPKKV